MLINFKLAHDNKKDLFLKALAQKISQSIVLEFGGHKSFTSLYLAGSLSRGEGSVVKSHGQFLLLSDFDFFLVIKDLESVRSISRQMPPFLEELNRTYRKAGILSEIDCGVIANDVLKAIRPTLFWYEFAKSGKLIAGNSVDFSYFHKWDHGNISKMEGLILLQNRAMEQLIHLPFVFQQSEPLDEESFLIILYLAARSFCDMAKSYLLHKGLYAANSLERLEIIKKMNGEPLNPELIDNIAFWTSFKMDPCIERVFERFGRSWTKGFEILQEVTKSLHDYLVTFWKVEVNETFKKSFSDIGQDIWTIRTTSFGSRTKAWLSYGKNELLRKRSFPLHKIPYYVLYNQTPMWVSHLAGIMLYDTFFALKKNKDRTVELANLLLFITKRLPNTSKNDFKRKSFLDTWDNLRKKTLTIWSKIALGGRKNLSF